MNFIVSKIDNNTNIFKDCNGTKWNYLKKDEFLNKYPNGGYLILADMKKKECKESDLILSDSNNSIKLYPFKRKLKYYESVTGYIRVDNSSDNSYIRIVSNAWIKNIILPICFILFLITILFFLWNLTNNKVPNLDESAVSYFVPGVENTKADDNIALPGISIIKANANDPIINYPLQNPKGNQCYMIYNIYDDSNILLYKSGLIEPGKAVKTFKLNKSFPKGNYKIRIIVESRDINNYKTRLNDGEVVADLQVK